MFAIGDIVQIFAPVAGYNKYHLCIFVGSDGAASRFIFLNSDPGFEGTYDVDCARVPCLPASRTGRTAFSFTMLPRYNDEQLKLYRAERKGAIDAILATELLEFARTVQTLGRADKLTVITGLEQLSAPSGGE